jgi:hypothetical protein
MPPAFRMPVHMEYRVHQMPAFSKDVCAYFFGNGKAQVSLQLQTSSTHCQKPPVT